MVTTTDAVTRHSIFVERLKARAVNEVMELVDPLGIKVSDEVLRSNLENLNRRQVQQLQTRIARIIRDGYGPINDLINQELFDFGAYEGEWQPDMLEKTELVIDPGTASDADIWAAVNAEPFEGRFLKGWLAGLSVGSQQRVREVITQGYADGLSAAQVARQIVGTRRRPGVWNKSRNGAATMVRTAFTHTATVARDLTYDENPTIRKEQHLSILDGRTTPICRALDGRIFVRGSKVSKRLQPPLHPACRSTRQPVTGKNADAAEGRVTYQQWLAKQPAALQDDILGPTRGRLFRSGDITLDRFVDESGQQYTLEQLRQRDAAAWDEVFGDDN